MIQQPGRTSGYAALGVLIYSSDPELRSRTAQALGPVPDHSGAALRFDHAATQFGVIEQIGTGSVDVAILDAEAAPLGGMGLAKQLKDELLHCPSLVVLIARPVDAWLARWSRADAVVPRVFDPVVLRDTTMALMHGRSVV
ncbi:hypothetical protein [Mycolicibacterium brisbanense]|uniref:hypothetical protein n=1 Tax=Mycolicibacterium brisbanense TaxID=146020 RepID=UPI0007A090AE|nr:hypothetical protein [Mycolicibacterium brisbanense]MCV7156217.1 hypothetical protein [Mycolicibacterium brisbanense]